MKMPDEPTTVEQWQVIAWGAIFALAVLGFVAVWLSCEAPAGKADLAQEVRMGGLTSLGLAALVYGVKRTIELFFA